MPRIWFQPDILQSSTKDLGEKIKSEFGLIDILINNVGGGGRWGDEDMITTNDEVWDQVYHKNFIVAKDLIQMFLPSMLLNKWGRVITITSSLAKQAGGRPWFNVAKMSQTVLMKNLAKNSLYSSKGVNPLGGCLPMLIQMPLLFSLFIVFRSTIEFRGAGFMFWINDLSQPDILFNLPFHIPIYGSYVAVLPILMGISIFMTQRLSMATMDPSQKPIMYIMNGFFILIFNSFPSGLNLYYTVYNLLNFFQQKSINIPTKPIK